MAKNKKIILTEDVFNANGNTYVNSSLNESETKESKQEDDTNNNDDLIITNDETDIKLNIDEEIKTSNDDMSFEIKKLEQDNDTQYNDELPKIEDKNNEELNNAAIYGELKSDDENKINITLETDEEIKSNDDSVQLETNELKQNDTNDEEDKKVIKKVFKTKLNIFNDESYYNI